MKISQMMSLIEKESGMAPKDQRIVLGLGTPNPRELTTKEAQGVVRDLKLKQGDTIKVFGRSHVN